MDNPVFHRPSIIANILKERPRPSIHGIPIPPEERGANPDPRHYAAVPAATLPHEENTMGINEPRKYGFRK